MAIDFHGDRALFKQLADILRAEIARGRWRPGDRLPSETALMQEYEVGRNTVRSAIAVLKSEGLVMSQPREGTIVAGGDPVDRVQVPPGAVVRTRMPTPDEARKLGIPNGVSVPVFVIKPGARKHTQVLRGDRTELVYGDDTGQ
ncbi:GntR family transcriptional regulator [Nonomuraea polychroma]|uniref:GntR family transcriptional regulator n=1 Tax=Nonomuraea polychroma TaxID=46176 RepID=UPI003D90B49D